MYSARHKNSISRLSLRQTGVEGDIPFLIRELDSRKGASGDAPLFHPYRQDYYFFFLPATGPNSNPAPNRRWIDFINYEWRPGNLYFTLPRHIHLKEANTIADGALLAFTEEFLQPEELSSWKKLPILRNPDDIHDLKLSGVEIDFLDNLFVQMRAEYSQQQNQAKGIMRSYLNIFLVYLSRIYTRQYNATPPSDDQGMINGLKELLNEKYDPLRQVADYARLLDTTPAQLNNRIKAYAGRNATVLIQERIVLEAKRALVLDDLSPKEIATSLGFEDAGFSRLYKRLTGETPTAFRAGFRAGRQAAPRAAHHASSHAAPRADLRATHHEA